MLANALTDRQCRARLALAHGGERDLFFELGEEGLRGAGECGAGHSALADGRLLVVGLWLIAAVFPCTGVARRVGW